MITVSNTEGERKYADAASSTSFPSQPKCISSASLEQKRHACNDMIVSGIKGVCDTIKENTLCAQRKVFLF